MKVTLRSLALATVIMFSGSVFFACQKSVNSTPKQSSLNAGNADHDISFCGFLQEDPLTAGQTIPAGTIVIGNDADNVYVTYNATGDWKLKELHLSVECNDIGGDCTKTKSSDLAPGKFPYKFIPTQTNINDLPVTYTFIIPIASLGNCTCFCVYPHAAVVRYVNGTSTVESQTAWGGFVQQIVNGKWYGGTNYCLQNCSNDTK